MRLPTGTHTRSPFRFNITPMIDVVFLLIIFFLVASYFVRSEQSRDVRLPEAIGGRADDVATEQRLTVTIEPDGSLSIGNQSESRDGVLQRIRSLGAIAKDGTIVPEVRIRTDRETRFGEIRDLMEACAGQGIGRIRFAVVQPTSDPAAADQERGP